MINILLKFLSALSPTKAYMVWEDFETGEVTYYGPFTRGEAWFNMDDAYGSLLRTGGDRLEIVELTWIDVKRLRRESDKFTLWYDKEFWNEQRDALEDDEGVTAMWED